MQGILLLEQLQQYLGLPDTNIGSDILLHFSMHLSQASLFPFSINIPITDYLRMYLRFC